MKMDELFDKLLEKPFIHIIIAINLAGTLFGFYYYGSQLSNSAIYLWPLIPDSPLATLGIALSLGLYVLKRSNSLVDIFAFIANLKYGLWTAAVLLLYLDIFMAKVSAPMFVFLFVSHILMAFQAVLVYREMEFGLSDLLLVGGWFVINDIVDYTLNTHPLLSADGTAPELKAAVSAGILTLTSLIILYRFKLNRGK